MTDPAGREVLTIPASGVPAMQVLGWTRVNEPGDTPRSDTPTPETPAPATATKPQKPARKSGRARRPIPKPGDDD